MSTHDTLAVPCRSEKDMKLRLRQYVSVPANVDTAVNTLFENLVEDILLGVLFEEHYTNRLGGIPVMTEEEMKPFAIVENTELDIFAQQNVKKPQNCICPICNKPLSALKFAPHLANCLGMGRNSSRIASRSRRITNNCKENTYGVISDDDDDYWVGGQEKSKINKKVQGKKKKEKNGVRKNKTQKTTGDKSSAGETTEDFNLSSKYEIGETKN